MATDSLTAVRHLRPITLEPDALVTEVDAADFLKLSARTLQAWRYDRIGPTYVQAGRAIRYRRSDLVAWVQANAVLCSPHGGER